MDQKTNKGSKVDERFKKDTHNINPLKAKEKNDAPMTWYYALLSGIFYCLACCTGMLAVIAIIYVIMAIVEVVKVTQAAGLIASLAIMSLCDAAIVPVLAYTGHKVYLKKLGFAFIATILLIIPCVVQTSLNSTVLHFSFKHKQVLSQSLENLFDLSRGYINEETKKYHYLEYELKCCGFLGPDDYRRGSYIPNVPISCCHEFDLSAPESAQEDDRRDCMKSLSFYRRGCKDASVDLVKNNLDYLMSLHWTVIGLEIVMIILGVIARYIIKYSKDPKN